MKLTELMAMSDSYTDEVVTTTNAQLYANAGIAYINSKLGTDLPYFEDATTDYTALPSSWQRRLLLAWMNYSVKMNDSSLNEAGEYKMVFADAFADFTSMFLDILDDEYLPTTLNDVYTIDTTDAIDYGWFYNSGRGGL